MFAYCTVVNYDVGMMKEHSDCHNKVTLSSKQLDENVVSIKGSSDLEFSETVCGNVCEYKINISIFCITIVCDWNYCLHYFFLMVVNEHFLDKKKRKTGVAQPSLLFNVCE